MSTRRDITRKFRLPIHTTMPQGYVKVMSATRFTSTDAAKQWAIVYQDTVKAKVALLHAPAAAQDTALGAGPYSSYHIIIEGDQAPI